MAFFKFYKLVLGLLERHLVHESVFFRHRGLLFKLLLKLHVLAVHVSQRVLSLLELFLNQAQLLIGLNCFLLLATDSLVALLDVKLEFVDLFG